MSNLDPNKVPEMDLDQLVEAYSIASQEEEDIVAEKVMLREAILPLIPDDGTISGEYQLTKMKRKNMKLPTKKAEKEAAMAKLRELGLVEMVEKVDMKAAEALQNKGVQLPFEVSYTISPVIRRIEQEEITE